MKALLAVALVGLGLLAGRLVGAEGVDRLTAAEEAVSEAFLKVDLKEAGAKDNAAAKVEGLNATLTDPAQLKAVTNRALWKLAEANIAGFRSPQYSQIAAEQEVRLRVLEVQQNQRIIELLERLADAPKVK